MADEHRMVKMLLALDDLYGVGTVALLALARGARVEHLKKGERLPADEHLDRHVYLAEGVVHLVAEGKSMGIVSASSERARSSLFRIHTHGLYAECMQDAALLSLDEKTFEEYVRPFNREYDCGIHVYEHISEEKDASLLQEINLNFDHREVDIPSLPDIARRIYHGVSEKNVSIDKVVELLHSDPAIAARVIQVASSSLYSGENVNSVREAINLIGVDTVHTIVATVLMRDIYSPKGKNIRKRLSKYYMHSIRVGAIAHVLSQNIEGFDPDKAFLAGLLHDIGVVPLLIQADKRGSFESQPGLIEPMLRQLSHRVGKQLLEQWGFDPSVVSVAKESEDWQREVEQPDYCDIVQVAQLHCSLLGGVKLDAPPLNQLPAFRRLNMEGIDPIKIVTQAKHEVKEVVALLS